MSFLLDMNPRSHKKRFGEHFCLKASTHEIVKIPIEQCSKISNRPP